MSRINPTMKLDGFNLKDALESIYCTFASSLLFHKVRETADLCLNDIPQLVFEVAVGAGWFPLAKGNFDPTIGTSQGEMIWQADWRVTQKTVLPQWILEHIETAKDKGIQPPPRSNFTKNQAQRIVQFGEFYVERTYVDSFYDLLKETIASYLGSGTLYEERRKSLPATTTARQRKILLDAYISKRKQEEKSIKITDIAELAGVDYSVFMRWKRGENVEKGAILDSSDPGIRIAMLLRFDQRGSARLYRK